MPRIRMHWPNQLVVISLLVLTLAVHANPNEQAKQATVAVEQLYHDISKLPNSNISARLHYISQYFLGKPYLLGALGEGAQGHYDQYPKYRTDAFDCETYVDTVLALALAQNSKGFEQCIDKIRYRDGQPVFTARNHFTELDWNINNQKQGLVKDITLSIHNKEKQPIAKIASAWIDKPAWYAHFNEDKIRLITSDNQQRAQKLRALKAEGKQLGRRLATIPYLPLDQLFSPSGQANQSLFAQIPNGAIIEIVRPNWDLRQQIGTCLNVSHLGFAFWEGRTLMFYQASSQYGQVVVVPLISYLADARNSPTIKGINVQIVLPKYPLAHC